MEIRGELSLNIPDTYSYLHLTLMDLLIYYLVPFTTISHACTQHLYPPPNSGLEHFIIFSNKLTLLHSEWPKLFRVLAILSATGLISWITPLTMCNAILISYHHLEFPLPVYSWTLWGPVHSLPSTSLLSSSVHSQTFPEALHHKLCHLTWKYNILHEQQQQQQSTVKFRY